ncbi:HlyD family secretion protein [Halomonas sp. WWR20]
MAESQHEAAAQPASSSASPADRPRRGWWQRRRMLAGIVIGLAILAGGGAWLYGQLTHVNVTDARVAADMVVLSSRVPGWVTDVEVIEGDTAVSGQTLVTIDARESRLKIQELDAQLAAITASHDETQARWQMVDHQTQSAIEVAKAAVASAEAKRKLAQIDNQRVAKLVKQGAVNQARLDQTQTALETARQDLGGARARLQNAQADREELAVLKRQLAGLEAQAQQLRAQRQQAQLDLEDRALAMPFDGVVDRVFVDDGEYVTPGQRLLMVHDPQAVRVEANIKETDIRHFRPGKNVDIRVDALPDQVFDGAVERVGQSATSEFALLPSPNPSGNFTKITQRLPVRIAVSQRDGLLKPGMMVELEAATGE